MPVFNLTNGEAEVLAEEAQSHFDVAAQELSAFYEDDEVRETEMPALVGAPLVLGAIERGREKAERENRAWGIEVELPEPALEWLPKLREFNDHVLNVDLAPINGNSIADTQGEARSALLARALDRVLGKEAIAA